MDGREQNRRDISRARVKDVNVSILKSKEVEDYRRRKKNCWWSECTQMPLDMQATHVIINGLTNAELNEVVITMDRDEAPTESGITKIIDMLDEYLTLNPFLELNQTYRQSKGCQKGLEIS